MVSKLHCIVWENFTLSTPFDYKFLSLFFIGKTAQVQSLRQILPNAGRSQVTHVRSQRIVAVQMSHLLARIQQADEPQEPPLSAYR
jgi:hypothetical protein